MKKRLYFVLSLLILFCLYVLCAGRVSADQNIKNDKTTKFKYHQKPIRKVKEKSIKVRVAISRFEDKLEIEGSPFNIIEDTAIDSGTDAKDINITIKAEEKLEETEVTKRELLTGLLSNALHNTNMFEIVERSEVNELIREINFQHSEWAKDESINTLGNIYGVQYIVTGEILRSEAGERPGKNYYVLSIRMLNVNTGEVVSSSAVDAPYLKDAVDKAAKDLAAKVKSKPWTCRVVGMKEDIIYINAGMEEDLEEKDIFSIYRLKDKITDPETKKTLGFVKEKIALVQIREVLEMNLSSAKILEEKDRVIIGDVVSAASIVKDKKSELDLWREIQGSRGVGEDFTQESINEYSLSGYDFSPENIMANIGNSVVKIQSEDGVGSGFIISENNYIVTNYHVVRNSKFVSVKMIERNKYLTDVEVVKVNAARDIALLKVKDSGGLRPVTLGDSDNIRIGERVVAIGNPEGLENTISDGLVSGIRDFNDIKLIQTSVPVTHGSSGGPLVNMEGEVIGVVTSGLDKEGNINFAVPINYVKEELL